LLVGDYLHESLEFGATPVEEDRPLVLAGQLSELVGIPEVGPVDGVFRQVNDEADAAAHQFEREIHDSHLVDHVVQTLQVRKHFVLNQFANVQPLSEVFGRVLGEHVDVVGVLEPAHEHVGGVLLLEELEFVEKGLVEFDGLGCVIQPLEAVALGD